jgi:hypothetical protein
VSIAEQEDNEKDKEVMSINLAEIEKQSADILADLGEIAIDSFFIQKLYEFVRNPSTIDPEKRQQFRDKMAKDRDFAKRTAKN